MDELHDLIAEAKALIARADAGVIGTELYGLSKAVEAAEALLDQWAAEEARLADREG